MAASISNLEEYIADLQKKSPFLVFEDGVAITGIYKGVKIVDNSFDPGTVIPMYALEIEGIVKTFKSGSGKLAKTMKEVKVGETVQITKTGSSFKTEWQVLKK